MVGMVVPLTVLLILFCITLYLELERLLNSAAARARVVRRARVARSCMLSPDWAGLAGPEEMLVLVQVWGGDTLAGDNQSIILFMC